MGSSVSTAGVSSVLPSTNISKVFGKNQDRPSKRHFGIELVSGQPQTPTLDTAFTKVSVDHIIKTTCPSLFYNGRGVRMVPTPFLLDGRAQTVYSVMQARKRDNHTDIRYDRELMDMCDGGIVSLDWYPERPVREITTPSSSSSSDGSDTHTGSASVPIVVVLPGSMGSSSEYYIRHLATTLDSQGPRGCRMVVVNHRGFARTPCITTRVQSFGYTDDLRQVIDYLQATYPESPLGAVGYSMGGNMLTKYLGEQSDHCKLSAAVTVCCPYDVTKLYSTISKSTLFNNRVLQPSLTKSAKWFIRRYEDVIQSGKDKYDIEALLRAKTVVEIDTLLTAPISGYESCEQYYRESSSFDYVPKIRTPLLAINSRDDPMVPVDAIPVESFRNNPSTALVLVKHGGHLGFFSGMVPRIWYMDPLVEFFNALLR
ncbi:hypothetical protein FB645_005614 [Coemansia sp. IMI 203386]|nr:hypothetical protein FB645_005614 [Coemansia sp. IMI 203386]